mmetsp:Transcript_2840/g.6338  ORF Transcript_2840/g.6338 Transcript_2840/m.6338 type:complete len:338 (+) Transcript_2840:54-1067(+)
MKLWIVSIVLPLAQALVSSPVGQLRTPRRPSPRRWATDGEGLNEFDRNVIASVASLGLVETTWINVQKFGILPAASSDVLCSGASVSCSEILNGPWSTAFGTVPLTVPGMLAYAAVVLLALCPGMGSSFNETRQKGLVLVSTGMGVFSLYLISILAFKIGSPCPYCILSASFSLFLAAFINWKSNDLLAGMKLALSSASATFLLAVCLYITTSASIGLAEARTYLDSSTTTPVIMSAPPITEHSSVRAVRLGKALQARGAKMYGAYWCSHCFGQKQRLGQEAMRYVEYIECAKDGEGSKTGLCKDRKVPGYPTWEINGELHPGEMSLDELEEMVGLK